MAIPKGIKRARPAAAGGASKKAKIDTKAVSKALLNADLPKAVCSVLSTSAPYALAQYSEDRTPHQVSVVTMVGSALSGIQASLQKAVEDASGKVNGQSEEKASRDAAVFEAAKEIAMKKSAAAKKEYEELEATFFFRKADAALKETTKEQKAGDKAYEAIQAKIGQVEAIKAKVEVMKAGACPRKDVAALEKDMKPFNIDHTLVQSMHMALIKEPSELSDFEKVMMGKLDDELTEKLEGLKTQLAAEQPAKDARAAALDAAKTAQSEAKEKMDQCKEAFSEANSGVTKAKAALKEAEAKVASYDADMKALEAELSEAKDELDVFSAGPLAKFEVLKVHTAPPPEPEEPSPAPEPEAAETQAPPVAEDVA